MRDLIPPPIPAPAPLACGVAGAFQVTLWMALALAPTVFGCLHRFASFDLLLVVCLLLAFWVLSSLVGAPLLHVKSWANGVVWLLLALVLFQVLPLPGLDDLSAVSESLGKAATVLVDGPAGRPLFARHASLEVGRYSLRPTATVGVLVLLASATGLYWLVGSALIGRARARRGTWALLIGLSLLAVWVIVSALGSGSAPTDETGRRGPVLILGGDSLVPALLAALALAVGVVVRLVGWTPRLHYHERQTGSAWLTRAGPVGAGIGLLLAGLIAAALAMSNVPRALLVGSVVLSVGFVLGGYVVSGPRREGRTRPLLLAAGVGLWLALALWAGALIGPQPRLAGSGDEDLRLLMGAMPKARAGAGAGAGAVSPHILFGDPGWPGPRTEDHDTDTLLAIRAETGWAGLAVAGAGVVALVVFLLQARRRAASPWTQTAVRIGFGVMAANLLYAHYDAVVLLAPNLLALAGVFGLVTAWSARAAAWRTDRILRESHWPLVLGALVLVGALGVAENDMLSTAAGPDMSDKVLHFGTFAVVNILLCYALGPVPGVRWLKTRILAATVATASIGIAMEYAQRYLTVGRAFEIDDMVSNLSGAVLTGVVWWVVRRSQEPLGGSGSGAFGRSGS